MTNTFDPELASALTNIFGDDKPPANETPREAMQRVGTAMFPVGHAAIKRRKGNVLMVDFGKAA